MDLHSTATSEGSLGESAPLVGLVNRDTEANLMPFQPEVAGASTGQLRFPEHEPQADHGHVSTM